MACTADKNGLDYAALQVPACHGTWLQYQVTTDCQSQLLLQMSSNSLPIKHRSFAQSHLFSMAALLHRCPSALSSSLCQPKRGLLAFVLCTPSSSTQPCFCICRITAVCQPAISLQDTESYQVMVGNPVPVVLKSYCTETV